MVAWPPVDGSRNRAASAPHAGRNAVLRHHKEHEDETTRLFGRRPGRRFGKHGSVGAPPMPPRASNGRQPLRPGARLRRAARESFQPCDVVFRIKPVMISMIHTDSGKGRAAGRPSRPPGEDQRREVLRPTNQADRGLGLQQRARRKVPGAGPSDVLRRLRHHAGAVEQAGRRQPSWPTPISSIRSPAWPASRWPSVFRSR